SEDEVERFLSTVSEYEHAMVESHILLIKYWLEVNQEEQTRRLTQRIEDGRKIWKLSPMDLASYGRWYDYSRARDAMLVATDKPFPPWYVVRSDDRRRARLTVTPPLLSRIPYEDVRERKERQKLPPRQKANGYVEPDYPYNFIPEKH